MKPTVGRIVHYILPDPYSEEAHRPAMIVRVWSETTVNLQVFVDGTNDRITGVTEQQPTVWRTSVNENADGKPGTWHWPERDDN